MMTDEDRKAAAIGTPARVSRHAGAFAHLDPEDAGRDTARDGWITA